jgi:aminoglycoside phosphotransferase (APT) family kinase protein
MPLHGDLTPWNLRRCAGEPWLLDWEDITWGPPGADEAYFHATATAVCGAELCPAPRDAVDHWLGVVSGRTADGAEEEMRRHLLATLRRMAAAPPHPCAGA